MYISIYAYIYIETNLGDKTRQSLLNSQARNEGISELIVIYNYANLS